MNTSTASIVFEDHFLPMYINQFVSGRSIGLQGQIARIHQQESVRQSIREAQVKKRTERFREAEERYAMSKEDPKVQKERKKTQQKRKKELKRL